MSNAIKQQVVTSQQSTPMVIVKPTLPHEKVLSTLINELQPINYKALAGVAPDEKLKRNHQLIITIEQILKNAEIRDWSLCMNEGLVYIYNGEYWHPLSKHSLNSFLGRAAEKLGIDSFDARYHAFKAELLKQFMSSAYLPKPRKKYDEVLINLQNGTFVITPTARAIRPFDRGDFLTYQLPFDYADSAKASIFIDYLNKVLPDTEQQMVLAEYVGYLFIRQKTLKLEKTLILFGNGANGKSVFFDILNALLGTENVSQYSLQSLCDDKGYHRAKLADKLLNYASEISPKMNVTIFKQLVSGEQIEARSPNCEPFILEDYAKFIFNTNGLPTDVEHNEAFFRRFLILDFAVTLPENDRNPELAKSIIKNELPGVFNWVLAGLKRLLIQKKFTQSKEADKTLNNYKLNSDSVKLFIADLEYEPDLQHEIPLKTMFSEYKQYCIDFGYRYCTAAAFGGRIRNNRFDTHKRNHGFIVFANKKSL